MTRSIVTVFASNLRLVLALFVLIHQCSGFNWETWFTNGTYTLSTDRVAVATVTTGDMRGNAVTLTGALTINGIVANETDMGTYPKISGNHSAWLFFVPAGFVLDVSHLILEQGKTFTNGYAP